MLPFEIALTYEGLVTCRENMGLIIHKRFGIALKNEGLVTFSIATSKKIHWFGIALKCEGLVMCRTASFFRMLQFGIALTYEGLRMRYKLT